MTPLSKGFLDRPFAHRALHGPGHPENSPEAIMAAVEAGFGIELDVQLSKDGAAVVFHDYSLARMTGNSGTVQTTDAAALARINLFGGSSGAPLLSEALGIIGGVVPVLVEIKDQDGELGPKVGALERAVAKAVTGYGGQVAVMSFNPHAVAAMADLAPDIPRGLTTAAFTVEDWPTVPAKRRAELAEIPDLDRVGASFISHSLSALKSAAVASAKTRGLGVLCWTVRSQAEAREALKNADQITFEGFTPA